MLKKIKGSAAKIGLKDLISRRINGSGHLASLNLSYNLIERNGIQLVLNYDEPTEEPKYKALRRFILEIKSYIRDFEIFI